MPRFFNFAIKWGDNGTIVSRVSPAFRLVLVESALLEDIYRRIETAIGASIRHVVFEAERAASAATIGSLMPDWLINRVLRNRVAMHPASRFLQLLARMAGLADAHTIFYHVFRGSLARVRNEFNREIFAAMVVGAFERMEGVVYDHDWIELGGELFLFINPAREKPEIAGRMKPEIVKPLPGQRGLDLCRRCGFPAALGHLRWDIPNAVITDTRRGVRMSFVENYAFSAVFRELISELGEEIVPIIVDASSEYTLRSIEETGFFSAGQDRAGRYADYLALLPIYGYGNPVHTELSGESFAVTMENPYSVLMLAGQLGAVYEAVEGHPGSVAIDDRDPRRVRISVGT
jgi:hypothetical protein